MLQGGEWLFRAQSGRTEIASFACAANRQPQSIQELRCNAARKADIGRDRSEVRGVYDRVAGQSGLSPQMNKLARVATRPTRIEEEPLHCPEK
jgi:hypothetical protein